MAEVPSPDGHPQQGTAFTFFDYAGLGFILEPPAVIIHAAMTGEPLRWPMALYGIPFFVIGAISIYVGRHWHSLKTKWNYSFVKAIDHFSASLIVLAIVFLLFLSGIAILPILLWPPGAIIQNPASSLPSRAANPSNPAVEATKNLSSADHERLADALYDISQLFDRAVKLSDSASREVFQIGNDADAPGSISREQIETHRQRLVSLLESARLYSTDFDGTTEKWKYYTVQIAYIVGDRPNDKMMSLRDTINSYIQYFDAWSKIKNIEEPAVRQIVLFQQLPFSQSMDEVRMWGQGCERRLQEIKNALQQRN